MCKIKKRKRIDDVKSLMISENLQNLSTFKLTIYVIQQEKNLCENLIRIFFFSVLYRFLFSSIFSYFSPFSSFILLGFACLSAVRQFVFLTILQIYQIVSLPFPLFSFDSLSFYSSFSSSFFPSLLILSFKIFFFMLFSALYSKSFILAIFPPFYFVS